MAVDRSPSEYLAALRMPRDDWHFFKQVDSLYDIKEGIEAKKKAT
jgi:hypothetical protein